MNAQGGRGDHTALQQISSISSMYLMEQVRGKQQADGIRYTECFVAFIDLWGFKCLVKTSQNDPGEIATLVKALNRIALDTPQAGLNNAQRDGAGKPANRNWVVQSRPFSDCVCLFVPTESGGLTWLLRSVRYIHDRMLELDVCIRGAITIGGMYWDEAWSATSPSLQNEALDQQFGFCRQSSPKAMVQPEYSAVLYQADAGGFPITLGPGLIEAYELERDAAVYPRVIASASLERYLAQNGSVRAFPLTSSVAADSDIPLREFFRTSGDGRQFLDLLHEKVYRQDTERITLQTNPDGTTSRRWERRPTSWREVLALANNLADRKLKGKLPDAVRAKYEWLKEYVARSMVVESP